MRRFIGYLLPLLSVACLCAGCLKGTYHPDWISKISMLGEPIGPEEIFRLPDGDRIAFSRLLDDVTGVRVIFIGESHDRVEHHSVQLKVLRGLLERGNNVVVGMEMFERSRQPVLDQWSRGLLTEEEFLKRVQWETSWGFDYDLYRGILEEVRARGLKLLGLNVNRNLVRRIAQDGIEGLPPEEMKELPEMDLSDQAHRTYIASIYRRHASGEAETFDHFYQAQSLWDEGMAEGLSEFLRSPEGEGRTILVLAGKGHIVFDFGIPRRLYRRVPTSYRTIVLKEWTRDPDGDLTWTDAPPPLSDYLWITKPAPPEKERPRIGVFLKKEAERLWIERVLPGSPAEKAGLLAGDQLAAVEGKEITKPKDIHDALAEKGWGKEVTFSVLREGVKKEITVTLPAQGDGSI